MAAPLGNKNAAKAKKFRDALSRALARAGDTVDGGLNKVTDQLVTAAIRGEAWAIKEVRDTMDGKPAQALIGDEDSPLTVVMKKAKFVRPD